jgi:hypothetical protein
LGILRFEILASAKRSSRLRTIFRCALAHLLITSKSQNLGYFAKRLVGRPRNGRQVPLRMAKRRRTVATVLYTMPPTEDIRCPRALLPGWLALVLLVLLCKAGSAQSSQEVQFLPEIDAYLKLNPDIRVSAQAKDTREGGASTQAEIGPSMEFYTKPMVKLKEITAFDLDDARARPLGFRVGYRYLAAPGKPGTNRIPIAVTSRLPTKGKLLLTDRNRADLDWSNGSFTWRYRNMLSLERTLGIHSYHPMLYASAEIYYESQYGKVSTTELYAGAHIPMGKHYELNPYYEHQNNTGKHPNQQLHGLGLTLDIYFSKKAH